jgi:glycosyltransferase involved in cell wall biosynthesis
VNNEHKISDRVSILFLGTYPKGIGASQRFRLEIYLAELERAGISYEYHPFLREEEYTVWYERGKFWPKTKALLNGFLKRVALMAKLSKFDKVFIQREAAPLGPPIFEWYIGRLIKKPIVYDIDDAIWIPNYSKANARFKNLKCFWKVDKIITWSNLITAGNNFLAEHCRTLNHEVKIIPTVVDTEDRHNPEHYPKRNNRIPVIGWTGSLSTNIYIEGLQDVFLELEKSHEFKLLIISNARPNLTCKNLEYRPWSAENEIRDLSEMDFGIMPLDHEDEFAKGKCGFKIIQYMAMEIIALASPIGINRELITDGVNGFLCSNQSQWKTKLEWLLDSSKSESITMRKAGRAEVVAHYSKQSQTETLIEILKK